MFKVTVAVPVYNSARHLQANFDSLRNQTMPAQDVEILYINNCSTDNTRELIEAFARQQPNVKLINKTVNSGGPFLSMNDAIEAAEGKYIHFLDSDDFLCDDALQRLYDAAEKYNSDIIFGRYTGVNGRHVPTQMFKKGNIVKADIESDKLIYSLAPHKLYRTSFLREHNLLFYTAPATTSNEDQLFGMQSYLAAKTITVLADLDHYFVVARGDENITSKLYAAEKYLNIPNLIIQHIEQNVADETQKQRLKALYANRVLKIDHMHRHLHNPHFPADQKKEWLLEGQKFTRAAIAPGMMPLIDAKKQAFAKAVLAADMETVNRLAHERENSLQVLRKKEKQQEVTAKQKTLNTYVRPSERAAAATPVPHPHKPFAVFASVNGWFEVRLPLENGSGTHAVFIKASDVRYTLSTSVQRSVQRLKKMIVR